MCPPRHDARLRSAQFHHPLVAEARSGALVSAHCRGHGAPGATVPPSPPSIVTTQAGPQDASAPPPPCPIGHGGEGASGTRRSGGGEVG